MVTLRVSVLDDCAATCWSGDIIVLGAEMDPEVPQRQDDCREDTPWTEVDEGFFGKVTEDQTGRTVDTIDLGAELDPEVPQRQDNCREDAPWTEVDEGFFSIVTEDQTGPWIPSTWGQNWTLKSPRGRMTAEKTLHGQKWTKYSSAGRQRTRQDRGYHRPGGRIGP
ncbi:uncharacterized protein [Haliotis asinina]|uniref:uncharacterized protein n=1 Tax=Haliotis asinina TaxID=109174 RepID=UPI003531A2CD